MKLRRLLITTKLSEVYSSSNEIMVITFEFLNMYTVKVTFTTNPDTEYKQKYIQL